jgi:hypothetical protein
MAFRFFVTERAQLNIDDSIDWYEYKSENLGKRFYTDFEATLSYIIRNPYLFPIKQYPFRETPLSSFPFVIIYDIVDSTVVIVSVFNTSKNPGKKSSKF